MQNYFFNKKYRDVFVFCSGEKCRNNVGNWCTRNIESNSNNRDFNYYAAKDLQMAEEADFGFMIWDAKSKGTLHNIVNLLKASKHTLVFFPPERNFYKLNTFDNLRDLLKKCDKKTSEALEKEFRLSVLLQWGEEQASQTIIKNLASTQPTLWEASREAIDNIVVRDK
ncbi:MAG: hypothetical protein Q8O16_06765 [Dehalococcoidia bacterium]|nr:hypothetical protein [Dehalococcoidia bacterium]